MYFTSILEQADPHVINLLVPLVFFWDSQAQSFTVNDQDN